MCKLLCCVADIAMMVAVIYFMHAEQKQHEEQAVTKAVQLTNLANEHQRSLNAAYPLVGFNSPQGANLGLTNVDLVYAQYYLAHGQLDKAEKLLSNIGLAIHSAVTNTASPQAVFTGKL